MSDAGSVSEVGGIVHRRLSRWSWWERRRAYHPRALLSVWLYGFMTSVRSCRKLEAEPEVPTVDQAKLPKALI